MLKEVFYSRFSCRSTEISVIQALLLNGETVFIEDFEECVKNGSMPSGWKLVRAKGDKDWYIDEFDNNKYASVTGYSGKQPPFDAWLITPALDITNAGRKEMSFLSKVRYYRATDKLEVYLMSTNDPATAQLIKLDPTLASASEGGQSDFISSGTIDLSQYSGTYCIGFRYVSEQQSNYTTWQMDNFKFGGKALLQTLDDFETMNGGQTTAQQGWTNLASTKGWTATNAALLMGGVNDAAPVFQMIGKKADGSDNWAYAVHLNGNINSKGILTSPVFKGGLSKLTLNYGYVLSESNGVKFNIYFFAQDPRTNPVQNPIRSFTVNEPSAAQKTAYTATFDVNISGDCYMEIIPASPTNSTSNKDRVAIWNVIWDPAE